MSATMTAPPSPLQQAEDFKMPVPYRGQKLLFWRRGNLAAPPEIAFAITVHRSGRSVEVQLLSGQMQATVIHRADPRCLMAPEQKENGVWDFAEEHTVLPTKIDQIERRLDRIESRLDELFGRKASDTLVITDELRAEIRSVMEGMRLELEPPAAEASILDATQESKDSRKGGKR